MAHTVIVSKKELLIRTDWVVSSGRLEKASCKPRKLKSSLCLFSVLLHMFCMTHSLAVHRLSAASSMLWKTVCFLQTTCLGVTIKRKPEQTHSFYVLSYLLCFERLCPPLMEDAVWFSQDAETSLQPPGGKRGLGVYLFSRYRWAVMEICASLLQGMGVSVQADVMACLQFLPHPLYHVTTWSAENDAFSSKSIWHWLIGKYRVEGMQFSYYGWPMFSIQATLVHSLSFLT